jgi:hypothetical protein
MTEINSALSEEEKEKREKFFKHLSGFDSMTDCKYRELSTYLGVTSAAIDILKSVAATLSQDSTDKPAVKDTDLVSDPVLADRDTDAQPDKMKDWASEKLRFFLNHSMNLKTLDQLILNLQEYRHEKLEYLYLVFVKYLTGSEAARFAGSLVDLGCESPDIQECLQPFLEEYQ